MSLSAHGVVKRFANFNALDGIGLDVADGELLALLGPSGSGKTTLLRILAGLEVPDEGSVSIGGKDATAIGVRERGVGFVFQHYALFRHLTIFENVAFGLRVRPRRERPSDAEIKARVMELLELVQLSWVADRFPHQLSGGQRQRIALARALAVRPSVLLLDEPFGALDARVRQELRNWLRRLHDEIHITSVFVTHDQEEALEVADRVAILDKGRIVQIGSPAEVWERPASPFVFEFLGSANRFDRPLRSEIVDSGREIVVATGTAVVSEPLAYVRPRDFEVAGEALAEGVSARLESVRIQGGHAFLRAQPLSGGDPVSVEVESSVLRELGVAAGDLVRLRPRRVHVFARSAHEADQWLGVGSGI